ncbi:MAG: hypothetical protein EZS28_037989 [Streblomastix strix]|uniref:Uncharacterized protein n=1 Tax=Streblomastix strix TaxID=222440 RepID=A0A5J4U8C0_9EUKA|nr:MAG: hypothetical protein EZS28_037989 [Streblomastix strix]
MLFYFGLNGVVQFKGIDSSSNNFPFSDCQLVTMELNADVGTPLFFVDSIQQQVFVKGINESVKLQFWIYFKDS